MTVQIQTVHILKEKLNDYISKLYLFRKIFKYLWIFINIYELIFLIIDFFYISKKKKLKELYFKTYRSQ